MRLSIVIPVFNEKKTISEILKRVETVDLGNIEKEIIIVDDGSTDGTQQILKNLRSGYRIIRNPGNQGKGMALRKGFAQATGDIILVQDADLECDPRNYPDLVRPIIEEKADVVYGSRFLKKGFKHFSFLFCLGNKFLTSFSNLLTRLNLTDIWTGYKVFKKEVIEEILPQLTAKRFEIEIELTAKIVRKKYCILEVPLRFWGRPRTPAEGKKINWRDGFKALWYILKFNLF